MPEMIALVEMPIVQRPQPGQPADRGVQPGILEGRVMAGLMEGREQRDLDDSQHEHCRHHPQPRRERHQRPRGDQQPQMECQAFQPRGIGPPGEGFHGSGRRGSGRRGGARRGVCV